LQKKVVRPEGNDGAVAGRQSRKGSHITTLSNAPMRATQLPPELDDPITIEPLT